MQKCRISAVSSALLLGNSGDSDINDDDDDDDATRRPADSAYFLVFRCTPVQMQCKQRVSCRQPVKIG